MAVEGIKRGVETDVRPRLENAEVLDALRRGDIHQVVQALPAGVTRQDIEEYLKHRWLILEQGLLQNVQIRADEASVPAVTIERMSATAPVNALTREEADLLRQGLFGAHRAATTIKAATPATGGVAPAELTGMVESHLQEFDVFMNDIQGKILEAQLTQELEAKRAELKQELARIISLMREGKIDPEYVLIALAKVQISERGLLFAQYGRRMMHANEEQSRIAKEIGLDGSDPSKWGGLEVKRQQIGEKALSMQQFASMMQRLTQDIEAVFAFAKGAMEEIIKTKLELARKSEVRAT